MDYVITTNLHKERAMRYFSHFQLFTSRLFVSLYEKTQSKPALMIAKQNELYKFVNKMLLIVMKLTKVTKKYPVPKSKVSLKLIQKSVFEILSNEKTKSVLFSKAIF